MPANVLLSGLDCCRRNWGWYVALGLILVVLGTLAISHPYLTALAAVVVMGWLLLFSGVVQSILAFQVRDWGGFFLHLLEGILEAVVGFLLLNAPAEGTLIVTLLLAAYLLVGGLVRIFGALAMRFPGYGWVAFAGLISAALGVMLVAQWPLSGVWFLGTWVGIDLIFQGAAWIAFALAVRNAPMTPTPAV